MREHQGHGPIISFSQPFVTERHMRISRGAFRVCASAIKFVKKTRSPQFTMHMMTKTGGEMGLFGVVCILYDERMGGFCF